MRRRASRIAAHATIVGLAAAIAASSARAGDTTSAEDLFQLGKAALDKEDFARACPLLEASLKAEFALGTLLNLAFCHEREGRLATAWAEWRLLEDRARQAVPPQEQRASFANERAAELRDRLSRIRIDAARSAEGLVVRIDGVDAAPELWSVGVPVDPGPHLVVAKAPLHVEWSTRVEVSGGANVVTVEVSPLDHEPAEPAPVLALAPIAAPPPVHGSVRRTVGYAIGGIGIASLAVGSVFGALALSTSSDAACAAPCFRTEPDGSANRTLSRANDAYDRASTYALVSTVSLAAGAAGLLAGVVLVVTSPPSHPRARRLAPMFFAGGAGLLIGGEL